jgi:hypothetical protein
MSKTDAEKTTFSDYLKKINACNDAVKWVGTRTVSRAWADCERADWMIWLLWKKIGSPGWPDKKQVYLCMCACAETALPIYEKKYPGDNRPRVSIEMRRRWCRGEATATECDLAALAAEGVAGAAAWAAWAAESVAGAAAFAGGEAHKNMCEIIRGMFTIPREI